jgi:hypothetical protein
MYQNTDGRNLVKMQKGGHRPRAKGRLASTKKASALETGKTIGQKKNYYNKMGTPQVRRQDDPIHDGLSLLSHVCDS